MQALVWWEVRSMKKSLFAMLVLTVALISRSAAIAQQAVPTAQNQAQVEQPQEGDVAWHNIGYAALTIVADCVYVPLKLAYSGLGGVTDGAAYGLTGGNLQTADTIWRSSLEGDYLLTPQMVKGDRPIYFSGPTQTAPRGAADLSSVRQAPSTSGATSSLNWPY
jgi:hypothetical protein